MSIKNLSNIFICVGVAFYCSKALAQDVQANDLQYSNLYMITKGGMAWSTNTCNKNCDKSSFQYGAGVGYDINDKYFISIDYDYISPKYKEQRVIDDKKYFDSISSNAIGLNVDYKFADVNSFSFSVGGVKYWTSINTGMEINSGTHSYQASGISPSINFTINYKQNNKFSFFSQVVYDSAIQGVNNDNITLLFGVKFNLSSLVNNHHSESLNVQSSQPKKAVGNDSVNNYYVNNYYLNNDSMKMSEENNFLNIAYEADAFTPSPEQLKTISKYFLEKKEGCVILIGNASTDGNYKHNEELSKKRTNYIKKTISKLGFKGIVQEYYLGERFPYSNQNINNRRVDILYYENISACRA